MKEITIYLSVIMTFTILSGCKKGFLSTQDLTDKTNANFYKTPDDAQQALAAIYSSLKQVENDHGLLEISNIMSDECFGGGGQHDNVAAIDQWQESGLNMYEGSWSGYYQGIFRANNLIKYIDNGQIKDWQSADQKNQIDGEAHFLRAMDYFDLMRMFGGPVNGKMMGVPLNLDPDETIQIRASVDSIYAQIASDLKFCIDNMPSVGYHELEPGHATKWAAEALMARVFLFYNGQAYGRTYSSGSATMPLAEGGTITNAQVVNWVDDCISNSGYHVVKPFGNLWPYSYQPQDKDYLYPYAQRNHLEWVGDDGDGGNNPEAVFELIYTSLEQNRTEGDLSAARQGNYLPWGFGNGVGTASPTTFLTNKWFALGDIRRKATIWDVRDSTEGVQPDYVWGSFSQDLWEETGYWQKKITPINVAAPPGSGAQNNMWSYIMELHPDAPYQFWGDDFLNLILIRFSDVLLMGAELGSPNALTYLNEVHETSGLPPYGGVTEEAIRQERRADLAFEGVRYWDELRYGTMISDLQAESGVTIWNATVKTTYVPNIQRFNETKGFLPIPEDQGTLSKGVLEQNDGWTGGDMVYTGN